MWEWGWVGVEGSREDGQCLWSIFWWKDANEQAGDKKKALEFTVVLRRGGGGRLAGEEGLL